MVNWKNNKEKNLKMMAKYHQNFKLITVSVFEMKREDVDIILEKMKMTILRITLISYHNILFLKRYLEERYFPVFSAWKFLVVNTKYSFYMKRKYSYLSLIDGFFCKKVFSSHRFFHKQLDIEFYIKWINFVEHKF